MNKVFFYEYPIGRLGIGEKYNSISAVFFCQEKRPEFYERMERIETPLIKQAASQLEEYFKGHRRDFDLSLLLEGTDFQRSVWNSLLDIPYGHTCSYKDIAVDIGNPNACRAVGLANNRNPIVIIVPCHRVIGRDGSLTGYGGGLKVKEYLLNLENTEINFTPNLSHEPKVRRH